ncbi:MAG: hypothetical protein OEX00_05915, partial [Gammaproteobacteria bacterium]|nr:hypothetical protein [Gammaproteobacteria bacterium]
FLRNPGHPRMAYWCNRMMSLLSSDLPLNSRVAIANALLFHYVWYAGDRGKSSVITQILPTDILTRDDVAPFEKTMWSAHHASYSCWFKGDHLEVYDEIEYALNLANEHGIHLADSLALIVGACAAFMSNDLEKGQQLIQRSRKALNPARRVDLGLTHLYQSWASWLMDRLPEASEHIRLSQEVLEELGSPSILVRTYIAQAQIEGTRREYRQAYKTLAKARHLSRKVDSLNNLYICFLISADFALRRNRKSACIRLLKRAFALGRQQGFINIPWFSANSLAELSLLAIENGIETQHLFHLVKTLQLKPKEPPIHLREWPWPVRISTLDGFAIEIDGVKAKTSGKTQRRPLDILKYLVSCGGKNIRADQVMDMFWPELDYDKAYGVLHTNLHRLRKLLANEHALQWEAGRISLNPYLCWVDAWAFEKQCKDLGRIKNHNTSHENLLPLFEKALSLYVSPLLAGEEEQHWMLGYRQRLQNRYVRVLLDYGDILEAQNRLDDALDLYWSGIEIDNTMETFYQKVMMIYRAQGREFEAEAVYRQCASNLNRELGVKPSREMEKLYKQMLNSEV